MCGIIIFPPLILCVLGIALVIGPIFTTKEPYRYYRKVWRFTWRNILLYPSFHLPGVFTDNPSSRALNGSLWSLPVEFFCYIALMVTGTCVKFLRKYSVPISKALGLFFWCGLCIIQIVW